MFENATSSSPAHASPRPRWYLARGGERHGPIADAKLFALAAEDMIAPSDLVWRPGFLSWVSAGEMPGLLIPPPLPNAIGGRAMASADPAPRLSVVAEAPAAMPEAAPSAAMPHESGEEPATHMPEAETPAAHAPMASEPVASTVTSASVGWSGNKNLEALRDALRSAPNYAP
ncbi:MAG TPA: DUF4339 domain-containing protein [Stellaceae bacterium]|nr:DUF4339 domain-containing protein [Stellaceae bacterium]